MSDLESVKLRLKYFAQARDWEKYHTPKNLVMALMGEVGELADYFQWLTGYESRQVNSDFIKADEIKKEVADVFIYLIRLSDMLDIDLIEAANMKIDENEKKYPTDKVHGSAKKYTEYE